MWFVNRMWNFYFKLTLVYCRPPTSQGCIYWICIDCSKQMLWECVPMEMKTRWQGTEKVFLVTPNSDAQWQERCYADETRFFRTVQSFCIISIQGQEPFRCSTLFKSRTTKIRKHNWHRKQDCWMMLHKTCNYWQVLCSFYQYVEEIYKCFVLALQSTLNMILEHSATGYWCDSLH